jgi:flagellin-specific chaperone FliS
VNTKIETAFERLRTYVARAQLAVEHRNTAQALADTAEIAEIARRLWEQIQKENHGDPPRTDY